MTQEQRITFVLERTVIYVNYEVVQTTTGSQLILIRMLDPTPGIWTLQVYRAFPSPPDFHVWLPITGFSTSDVIFLEPDPYTTLTTPSATVPVLSPSTYQASNNSFSPESGRGFTRLGEIKPDFASPGFPSPDRDQQAPTKTGAAQARPLLLHPVLPLSSCNGAFNAPHPAILRRRS